MKMDIYTEIFLWNRYFDQLGRVLQRLEPFAIRPRQELKIYGIQLEEIRAKFNADFTEALAIIERADESRQKMYRANCEEKTTLREDESTLH